MQKQIHLAPQTAEEDAYTPSSATSTREFKILRKRVAEDKAQLLAQITVNAEQIQLMASKTYVDGIKANLEASITVNADAIALKASQSELNSLGDRVTTAESTLTIQADAIATKVSTTDLNTTLTNYSTITQTSTAISTYVGANVYTKDEINTTLGSYSTITQTAASIATRVATTDYNGNTIASLINQTATTITINAAKINLSGYVTFSNLSTSGQTTINGANISTGTLSADRIIVGSSLGGAGKIYLGSDYISLHGNSTSDATLNLVSSGGTARIYSRSIGGQPTISMDRALYVDGGVYASGGVVPRADNTYSVGFNTARWVDVWAVDGTINTSDMTDKKDIKKLENSSVAFIKALKPVKFKWKKGKREHLGFLAQEVKQAMDATIGDAGIFVDPSIGGEEGHQGLRYAEFISPIIDTLQNVLGRLEALENEVRN